MPIPPSNPKITLAMVNDEPNKANVKITVCGASRGDVIVNAVTVPILAPLRSRPSAIGMVAQAHPGKIAPKMLAKNIDLLPLPSQRSMKSKFPFDSSSAPAAIPKKK